MASVPTADFHATLDRNLGRWLRIAAIVAAAGFTAGAFIGAAQAEAPEQRIAPQQTDPDLRRLGDATTGALMLKSTTPGLYVEAPRLATDVKISVTGPLARTRVTQRFENTTDGWVEGIYVFPLPGDAAVDTLKMQIGDRLIEGVIEEREKARADYEAAKAAGKKASLVEQQRPNMFTNSVANIGPGETIIVQIEYQETVMLDDGAFSLRFPMVVAPRYSPPPTVTHLVSLDEGSGFGIVDPVPDRDAITPPVLHPDHGPINPVTLTVDLAAGFPLDTVTSSHHQIDKAVTKDGRQLFTLADGPQPADRDFELVWTPAAGDAPNAALYKETIDGAPHYLVMLTPPADESEAETPARDITFVIDTSGSMQGPSIRQAKASLALAISRLSPHDRFNVIQFNSEFDQLFSAPQPVTQNTMNRALGYVRCLDAGGGTEMLPALNAALPVGGDDSTRLRQVVFLTDGAIGNEQALFESIADRRGDARIFTVGIGSAPNSYFMSRAAELGQGSFTHIGDTNQVETRMTALLTKLERPAVTDVRASWPDGITVEAWPAPLPDLYHGETLVISAKADGNGGRVSLSGRNGPTPWRVDLDLGAARERDGVAKLWARKKIASLETLRAYASADQNAIDTAVLNTALTHGLVSRLTSLIAIDKTPSRPEGEPLASRDIPLNLPAGWDFEAVFGDSQAAMPALTPGQPLLRKAMASPVQFAAASPQSQGLALPQTATLWPVKALFGILLMLTGLCAFFGLRKQRL